MSVSLYMDVHVRAEITRGLRARGVDVRTAQEDGAHRLEDAALLDRAAALGRLIFSQDEDFLAEATGRQREGVPFAGVVYAHQLRVTLGQCIADLELIAKASDPADVADHVIYLPLR